MKKISCLAVACLLAVTGWAQNLRPPAVPLVTFDPFLSIWSDDDQLTGRNTVHWTKHEQSLVGLIRVDGQAFRVMGHDPENVPALPQTSLKVTPTRSLYEFEGAGVRVSLTFMTPALPDDLDAFSLPLSYITWEVRSVDGQEHAVELYDSTSSELAVNDPKEAVNWSRATAGRLLALRVGTVQQPVVGSSGDDHRIDWGYAYAAARAAEATAAIGGDKELLASFVAGGNLPDRDDTRMPRAVNQDQPVMAFAFKLGRVGSQAISRQVIVAYDEIVAIKYFGQPLLPLAPGYGRRRPVVGNRRSAQQEHILPGC